MRVKEKPHMVSNGSRENASSNSTAPSPKKQVAGCGDGTSGCDVQPDQVLDLSKTSKRLNGNGGTTETDAIHRRLTNDDRR